MKSAALPVNEKARLKALADYSLLDTLPEEVYDDITRIASEICRTPIALISLVDEDRQWYKSKQGISATEDSRTHSFCAHAILEPDEIFIVPDARRDDRFATNPLTTGSPNIVFYAGVPLVDAEGYPLGSLCVIDRRLRTLTDNQLLSLRALARLTIANFELRKVKAERDQYHSNLEQTTLSRMSLFSFLTDNIKPVVKSMIRTIQTVADGDPRPDQLLHLQSLQEAGNSLQTMLDNPEIDKS